MVGIFDSGIGGLTVVRELQKKLPKYDLIYFGDTARTPYGTKSKETIVKYALEDAQILLNRGAKVIIIACNTASAVAYETLKEKFKVPVFEVITPAVRRALELTQNKRIGVIGTTATINSSIYEKLLKEGREKIEVFSAACPLLVPLVEEGWLDTRETKMIVKKYLHPLRTKSVGTLILGCTHYPLLKKIIQPRIGKRVNLVDSAEEVVKEFQQFLKDNPKIDAELSKTSQAKYLASDVSARFQNIAEKWLSKKVELERVDVL
ncbi:MAG: glutamate racemase [Patescibacteria group bacterium]|nr:glutamate racemase [Patescibacteria group bacterium]MDD5490282.1 glutamate racemase [Patescibacteria group bacterium]